MANSGTKIQLDRFRRSLIESGHVKCPALKNWFQAFDELKEVVKASSSAKKILFIDEMPWMDKPNANFIPALENFWNAWASARKGAQIDLLIDRDDGVVNLCEMKFSGKQYALKEADDLSVRNKKAAFMRETGTRKSVHVTYVTTFGLVRNAYANSVQSEVTLDELFRH